MKNLRFVKWVVCTFGHFMLRTRIVIILFFSKKLLALLEFDDRLPIFTNRSCGNCGRKCLTRELGCVDLTCLNRKEFPPEFASFELLGSYCRVVSLYSERSTDQDSP